MGRDLDGERELREGLGGSRQQRLGDRFLKGDRKAPRWADASTGARISLLV